MRWTQARRVGQNARGGILPLRNRCTSSREVLPLKRRQDVSRPAGLDFLLMAADRLVDDGRPYAEEFRAMVWAAGTADPSEPAMLATEAIVCDPLEGPELVPVAALLLAQQAALKSKGGVFLARDVVHASAPLLIRWHRWLALTRDD